MKQIKEKETREFYKPTEIETIKQVESMCVESLSPDVLEQWENVQHWLINNRKNLESLRKK